MPLPQPLRFVQPKLVVKNLTSTKEVVVIGKYNLSSGETADLFQVVAPGSLTEDQIIRSLFLPDGDMYVEVVLKGTLQILEIDLPSFYYSKVFPTNLVAANQATAGAFPVAISEDEFRWYSFQLPLVLQDDKLVLPRASPTQDGYLSKEDYALFASVAAGGNFTIWQYQDFTAPVASSLTLTAFENGSGLAFNSGYIISGTASVVLISDTERPPTAVVSVPGVWLASNRVEVSSHIGTTVILNQAPHSSLPVRVFYQIALPAGISTPGGYEEDPNFVNERELDFFDDFYVNQNGDETIYGAKTFNDTLQVDGSLIIPTGAVDGYYLRSDGSGTAAWAPVVGGSGVSDHGGLTGLGDDDHPQYYNQNRLDTLIDGYEPSDSERFIPSGGTTGQALVKTSNADYDVEWEDVATGTSLDLSSLDIILDGYVSGNTFATTIDGYTTDAEFSAHTGDATIHFTAESLNLDQYITGTELHAVLDGYGAGSGDVSISFLDEVLDGYATANDLISHTGDSTIHFTVASLDLDQYIDAAELDAALDGYISTDEVYRLLPGTIGDDGYILTVSAGVPAWSPVEGLEAANGLPSGGTAGQILSKVDGTDFNAEWINADVSLEFLDSVLDGYLELGEIITDHGGLGGLLDDDHPQYYDIGRLGSLLDGYTTDSEFSSHIGDSTIHFTAESLNLDQYLTGSEVYVIFDGYSEIGHTHDEYITDVELDAILDGYGTGDGDVSLTFLHGVLDGYATESDFSNHISDSSVHFTVASLDLDQYIDATELDAVLDGYSIIGHTHSYISTDELDRLLPETIGDDGYVLTVDAGAPVWAPSASALTLTVEAFNGIVGEPGQVVMTPDGVEIKALFPLIGDDVGWLFNEDGILLVTG